MQTLAVITSSAYRLLPKMLISLNANIGRHMFHFQECVILSVTESASLLCGFFLKKHLLPL